LLFADDSSQPLLASCAGDAEVRLHDMATGARSVFSHHSSRVKMLATEPGNAHLLISCSEDGTGAADGDNAAAAAAAAAVCMCAACVSQHLAVSVQNVGAGKRNLLFSPTHKITACVTTSFVTSHAIVHCCCCCSLLAVVVCAAVRQLDVREAGGGPRQLLQLARNGVKLEINSISSPW
jgi:hypothetical protein